jgi:hypothetical protein
MSKYPQCKDIDPAVYCTSGNLPKGTICTNDNGKYCIDSCPAGYYCPDRMYLVVECPKGSICMEGSYQHEKCWGGAAFCPRTKMITYDSTLLLILCVAIFFVLVEGGRFLLKLKVKASSEKFERRSHKGIDHLSKTKEEQRILME